MLFSSKNFTQTSSYARRIAWQIHRNAFCKGEILSMLFDLEKQPFGAFKVLAWQNQIYSQKQGEQSREYRYRIVKWHLAKLYGTQMNHHNQGHGDIQNTFLIINWKTREFKSYDFISKNFNTRNRFLCFFTEK